MKKVDDGFFKVFQWVVDKWSYLTGKSNFKLAYLTLGLMFVFLATGLGLEYLEEQSGWTAFLIVIVVAAFIGEFFEMKKIEKAASKMEGSGTVPKEILEKIESRQFARPFWALLFTVNLVASVLIQQELYERLFDIGLFFWGAHDYIKLCINPGGKSLYERVKEKVRSFVLKPAAQPAPTAI